MTEVIRNAYKLLKQQGCKRRVEVEDWEIRGAFWVE